MKETKTDPADGRGPSAFLFARKLSNFARCFDLFTPTYPLTLVFPNDNLQVCVQIFTQNRSQIGNIKCIYCTMQKGVVPL